jgi:hypothetical protein
MKQSYLDFINELQGYTFHSKKTGYQVYKFEMYWSGLHPSQCFQLFTVKKIKKVFINLD